MIGTEDFRWVFGSENAAYQGHEKATKLANLKLFSIIASLDLKGNGPINSCSSHLSDSGETKGKNMSTFLKIGQRCNSFKLNKVGYNMRLTTPLILFVL